MGLKDKFNDKFPKRARPKKNVSKENWEYLDNQDVSDKSTYRDVYYDQDFKRGDLTHVPTFDSRRNIIIVLSVLLFITVYFGYLRVDAFVYDHFKDPTPQVENYRPDKKYYWVESDKLNGKTVYYAKDDPNNLDYKSIEERKTYAKKEQVPKPSWYLELEKQYKKLYVKKKPEIDAYNKKLAKKQKAFSFNLVGLLLASASSAILAGALYPLFKRNYEAQTVLYRTDDINQFKNDQHIMLPEEILQYKDFDIFPDAGCVSSVSPNALISHFAIKNKGLNKTMFTVRHKADVIDEETGEVIAYKGEPVRNEDGSIQQTKVDLIDEKFGDALFEASGQPEDVRGFFDISSTNYNSSGTRRERLGKFKTVSEMINSDWELPWYEPQRPAGFYMVDVTPTNTMV